MRVDINLSVREFGDTRLGSRTEIKNMNSFKAIKRAVEGESRRQREILSAGEIILQETRRWDDINNESLRMRSKEDAQDYRYFPEPDIPPLEISREWVHKLHRSLPEFRDEKIVRYQKEYDISEYDAKVLTSSKEIADLFENTSELCNLPKEVSNWLMVEGMRILKDNSMDPWDLRLTPKNLSKLIEMIDRGEINRTKGKDVFEEMCLKDVDPENYAKIHGLEMISDDKSLRMVAMKVLEDNQQSVLDYKNGKTKAFGNLVGQTMKAMNGKADPYLVNTILKELI